MSEPTPVYDPTPDELTVAAVLVMAADVPAGAWLAYLSRRREALIMELRALDRLLGRPQTIPERTR